MRYHLTMWKLSQTNPWPINTWEFDSEQELLDFTKQHNPIIKRQDCYLKMIDRQTGKNTPL